jgi:hypothetical protein
VSSNTRRPLRHHWRIAGALAKFIQAQDEFTLERFIGCAVERGLPLKAVTQCAGNLVKGFQSAQLIVKTNRYSMDAQSNPRVVWKVVEKGVD